MKKTLMIFLLIISSDLIIAQVKPTDPTKTDTSDLSKFLTEQNKKHLDQSRPIPQPGYGEDKKKLATGEQRTLDINKYRPYINNIDPDDPDLEKNIKKQNRRKELKLPLE